MENKRSYNMKKITHKIFNPRKKYKILQNRSSQNQIHYLSVRDAVISNLLRYNEILPVLITKLHFYNNY